MRANFSNEKHTQKKKLKLIHNTINNSNKNLHTTGNLKNQQLVEEVKIQSYFYMRGLTKSRLKET